MLLNRITKFLRRWAGMTLNIFFFSITIKKRQARLVDAVQNELAENLYEQNKDRQISVHHFM
jgi:uncharacterized protein (TIGR02413 family)